MRIGQPLEVHEHHHEQVEHDDAARVDEDLDDREEFGAEHDVEHRDAQEVRDQEQHAVHGVPRGDDHHPEPEDECSERVEHDGFEHLRFVSDAARGAALLLVLRTWR